MSPKPQALEAWGLRRGRAEEAPHFHALEAGRGPYGLITLRALDAQAAAFYRQLGFHESDRFEQATHWWPLRPLQGGQVVLSQPPP